MLVRQRRSVPWQIAGAVLALIAATVCAQMAGHEGHEGHDTGQAGDMTHGGMEMGKGGLMQTPPAATWAPEGFVPSRAPHTGMQMGVVETLNTPALGYEMDGNVKVFHLFAQPIEYDMASGNPMDMSIVKEYNRFTGQLHDHYFRHRVRVWGYNGSSPGPTIECTQGDRIRVMLHNELPEPTSIHWHGIELPNEMDGAGGLTEAPTPPGGMRVYEFTLYQNGTFLYHSGFNMMKQDSYGLAGFLVVHPKEYVIRPDRQICIMMQEWAFHPGNPNPDLVTMDFNWFTFNGMAAPDIQRIDLRQGERVRIRFGNMSMDSHPIHIHGYTWKVVGTEGGPIPESAQWPGNTINVPPGSTRDVEFVAWNPGLWRLHCHKLHHIINAHADVPMGLMGHGGMFTIINVVPSDPEAPWQHFSERGGE
ncbi:MAG: multicopper oxidase domain-containing protein [Acidobacteriota bacterium]|nr:multicopper oxidase domain-containing protein [Acidobacteriota bacterium]